MRMRLHILLLFCYLQWCISQYCSSSYISYTIGEFSNWKTISTTPISISLNSHKNVPIGFTFDFYGNSYTTVNIGSNGFINFAGNPDSPPFLDSGESIWLWWTSLNSTGTIQYETLTDSYGYYIFVVQYQVPPVYSSEPGLCSDILVGQIRLYEFDYSIEIEIQRAPLIPNMPAYSGIYSSSASSKIYLFEPFQFYFGSGSWEGPYEISSTTAISPDPGWSRILCPFPFAGRFVCVQCSYDSDCAIPDSSSGAPRCDNPPIEPTCTYTQDGLNYYCEHPFQSSQVFDAVTSYEPRQLIYNSDKFCSHSFGCCKFGPPTFFPPQDLLSACTISQDCYDTINSVLCDFCSSTPPEMVWEGRSTTPGDEVFGTGPYYYVSSDIQGQIDNVCGYVTDPDTYECTNSIFSWPNFPLKTLPECNYNLYARDDTITDGYGGYYENNVYCLWYIKVSVASGIIIDILSFDTEYYYDTVNIYTSSTNFNSPVYTFSGSMYDIYYDYGTYEFNITDTYIAIEFITDKDTVGTGFTFYYTAYPVVPMNVPLIIYDYALENVLTLTPNGGISLEPFVGYNYTQFWYFTESDNGNWWITNYDNDESISIDDNGNVYLTVDYNDTKAFWGVSLNIYSWIFKNIDTGYFLNNSLGLDVSQTSDDVLWDIEDSYQNYCTSMEIHLSPGTSGSIDDGSGPLLYPPHGPYYCSYIFYYYAESQVEIKFTNFDLAGDDDVFVGDVDGYNGIFLYGTLEDLDPSYINGVNMTSSFSIYFEVYSLKVGAQGFTLEYKVYCDSECQRFHALSPINVFYNNFCNVTFLPVPLCTSGVTYTSGMGVIDDGSGDDDYPILESCSWFINVTEADRIILYFCNFDTELFYDYLTVYDGPNESYPLYPFSGTSDSTDSFNFNDAVPSLSFTSSTNQLFITFISDEYVAYSGFHLQYTTIYKPGYAGCNCSQLCIMVQSGLSCYCEDGYKFDKDGYTCIDSNECKLGYCDNADYCQNYNGSYQCFCNSGYSLTYINTCIENDECALGTHNCQEICINTVGSFKCGCGVGKTLAPDGRTCSYNSTLLSESSVFQYSDFCNEIPSNFVFDKFVVREGCDAIIGDTGVIKKCKFPFIYNGVVYEECTDKEVLSKEKVKLLWCATMIDENYQVLEKGNCSCSKKNENIVYKHPSFAFISDDPQRAVDGIIDNSISSAFNLNQDEWYCTFDTWSNVRQIVVYGCSNCYINTTTFNFALHISLLTDVYNWNNPVWEKDLDLNNTFTKYVITLPDNVSPTRVLDVWCDQNIYIDELQVFDNVFNIDTPSVIDCSLTLSRSSLVINNTNLTEFEESPVYLWNDKSFNISKNFYTLFNFYMSPGSSDIFSFLIASYDDSLKQSTTAYNNQTHIRIALDPLNQTLAIIVSNDPPLNITSIQSNSTFSDGNYHYCKIEYRVGEDSDSPRQAVGSTNGRIYVYIDDFDHHLIEARDLVLTSVLGSVNAISGFSTQSRSSGNKRSIQDVTDPGKMSLLWWSLSSENLIEPKEIIEQAKENISTIIGAVVGSVLGLALILGIIALLLRQSNPSVDRLPSDIKRHYRQYSMSPRSWVIVGDPNGPHAFVKRLREGTGGYRRLEGLWHMMDGSGIEIEEAYAIHNLGLLTTFATKHDNLTTQVLKDPNTFLSKSWMETKDKHGIRKWTRDQYDKLTNQFRWNDELEVKIIPTIHGTNEDIAKSIIQTGFVALSKLDSGYYGKGIYFTTSAEYGLPYYATKVNPTVIISLVISGNAYPVIEHPRLSKHSFMGAALVPGYHSHYVLTRKDGYPCPNVLTGEGEETFYDEIVIEQESSVLPFYMLKISKNNLSTLALTLQKEQERLRKEEQERMKKKKERKETKNEGAFPPINTRMGDVKPPSSSSSSDEYSTSGEKLQLRNNNSD